MTGAPQVHKLPHLDGPDCPVCAASDMAEAINNFAEALRRANCDSVKRLAMRSAGAGLAWALLPLAAQDKSRARKLFEQVQRQFLIELQGLRRVELALLPEPTLDKRTSSANPSDSDAALEREVAKTLGAVIRAEADKRGWSAAHIVNGTAALAGWMLGANVLPEDSEAGLAMAIDALKTCIPLGALSRAAGDAQEGGGNAG